VVIRYGRKIIAAFAIQVTMISQMNRKRQSFLWNTPEWSGYSINKNQ
jgi:hypothetical protein